MFLLDDILAVRTALVALIAFMPTDPAGALRSLDYTKEERRSLAIKSCEVAPRFGTPERQRLIDEIHQCMLHKAPPYSQLASLQLPEEHVADRGSVPLQVNNQNADAMAEGEENAAVPGVNEVVMVNRHEVHLNANAGPLRVRFSAGLRVTRRVAVNTSGQLQRRPERRTRRLFDDRFFTWAAIGLTIAIVVLLLGKLLKAGGYGASGMDGL